MKSGCFSSFPSLSTMRSNIRRGKAIQSLLLLFENDSEAVLEVADFGAGMPDTDQKRVFDPFSQEKTDAVSENRPEWVLYLAKSAADQLGHRIELDSQEGKGTTIRLIFTATQNLTSM